MKQYIELIDEFVRENFLEGGFRKITLEEISSSLGISKKTIYKIYTSKEALTQKILFEELGKAYNGLIHLLQDDNSMANKTEQLGKIICHYIKLFNEDSLQILKKEHIGIWKDIIQFRKDKVIPLINLLLDLAKKHHLIIEYPNELIIKLFGTSLTLSSNRSYLIQSKSDSQWVFESIYGILINGILTKRGKKLQSINKRGKNENHKDN